MDKLIIFDTTLRDGKQSPGVSITRDDKVRIAKRLERMQVDVIEAGFPIASLDDFETVARLISGQRWSGRRYQSTCSQANAWLTYLRINPLFY